MNVKRKHASVTQGALLAILAVGVKLSSSHFCRNTNAAFMTTKPSFLKAVTRGVFASAPAFSVAVNAVPFCRVNSHIYLVKLEKQLQKAF